MQLGRAECQQPETRQKIARRKNLGPTFLTQDAEPPAYAEGSSWVRPLQMLRRDRTRWRERKGKIAAEGTWRAPLQLLSDETCQSVAKTCTERMYARNKRKPRAKRRCPLADAKTKGKGEKQQVRSSGGAHLACSVT